MSNLGILLEKAKWSHLDDEDEAWVAENIHTLQGADLCRLIQIIGRANLQEYRIQLEKFLHYESDPMISRIALWSLCSSWNESRRYLPQVKKFIAGVDWDPDNEIRNSAISISGEYLRDHTDRELTLTLLNIFADESENKIVRDGAYTALARSFGKDWNDIPPSSRRLDYSADVDWNMIRTIRSKSIQSTNLV